MANFHPSGSLTPERILMKLGMVNYVRDPIPHDYFGGCNAIWVVWANMWLVTSVSLFFLFFAFFSARSGRISSPICTIYVPKRVFPAKDVPFWDLDNIRLVTTFRGQNPKNLPKIGISQPNRHSSKIAIYRSPMKIFASYFTYRFRTGGNIEKKFKITSNGVVTGHVIYSWNLWLPSHLGNGCN